MRLINVAVDPPGRLRYFVKKNDGKRVTRRGSSTLGVARHIPSGEGGGGVKGPAD